MESVWAFDVHYASRVTGQVFMKANELKKGMAITTGAITGVHQAFSGQSSTVKCSGVDDIELALIPT